MNTNTKISVIIPCYNQAEFLKESCNSIIAQTYENWEVIIINDGSNDITEKVSLEFTAKDKRFKYVYQENGGLSSARNKGLGLATGEYIQLLDSDDIVAPDKFEKSLKHIANHDIIITNFYLFTKSIEDKIKPYCKLNKINFDYLTLLTEWDTKFSFPPHCCLVKKSIIGETTFEKGLKAKEDWVFWLDLFKKTPKIKFIDEKLAFYRRHENNMTNNIKHMNKNLLLACMHVYKNLDTQYKEPFFNKIANEYTIQKEKSEFLLYQSNSNSEALFEKAQLKRIKKAIIYKTILKLELFLRGIKKINRQDYFQ